MSSRRREAAARAILAAVVGLWGLPAAWATNGTRPVAVGTRAHGRGGVDVPFADDATAVATNPAGLAWIDGNRFDQAIALVAPRVRWRSASDADSAAPALLPFASLALAFDLDRPWRPAGSFDAGPLELGPSRLDPAYGRGAHRASPWKFALGVIPTRGGDARYRITTPFFEQRQVGTPPRTLPRLRPRHEVMQQEVGLHLGAAYRVNPWFSVGVSPSVLVSRIEIDKPMAQPTSILRGHPVDGSPLTYAEAAPFLGVQQIVGEAEMDAATTFGLRLKLGAMLQLGDSVSLGLSYAPRSWLQDYLARITVDLERQLAAVDPDGVLLRPVVAANTGIPPDEQSYRGRWNMRLFPQQIPQELAVGIAWRLPRLSLGCELTWIDWSSTFDRFAARLEDGTSAELNELVGDGATTVRVSVPLRWRDQLVVALGLSWAVSDSVVLRAGYNYGRSPMPVRYAEPTFPAVFEHHVTAGASVAFARFEASLAVEYALPVTLEVRRHAANLEYEGSRIEASLLWLSLGLGIRF